MVGRRLTEALPAVDLAFSKQGALGLPYVIAAIDTARTSNTPTEIFKRVEPWFRKMHGNTGAGCLLFVYHTAPAVSTIEEIQAIGGYVTAGAHDLHSGRHWLANHSGWNDEITVIEAYDTTWRVPGRT